MGAREGISRPNTKPKYWLEKRGEQSFISRVPLLGAEPFTNFVGAKSELLKHLKKMAEQYKAAAKRARKLKRGDV